ncbi:beta-glucosidase [Xylanibacter ruminicola]|uniref:Beta-glucosidase n=1 Tax=Xylanibacter ruminicola TaxID=839 RepID=A0A1M6SW26_XYLRU|nr:glycoside hydrolase family 3 C-terminal domain-containing protein [Xylanibacter ruminicola]SHK48952.1 beta-glucosidase [Xylanibacter ruminicola]
MKISFHQISLVVMAVAMSFSCSLGVSAQQLRAENIDEVVKAMTLEEKCHMVLGRGMHFNDEAKFPGTAGSTFSVNRLGIPETYCADSQQGLRMSATRAWDHHDYYPTDFVASMTLASTWDREAAFKVGKGIGNEVREFGLDWILSPAMNLIRNPLCGRNHEYYSEDPYLSGTIAADYVKGVQSEGTAACPKHFVANNQETNRNNNISQVSQRALREIYLKAFEIMVKESDPWTIMTSYNKLNGPYAVQNGELLTTIVRDEWGWKGMFVSDWNAGDDAVAAMLAGNDMLQPGQDKQYKAIYEAAKSGKLPMEVLDANVKRILEYVVKTHNFKGYKYSNEPDLKAHAQVVREVGADGIVLLKNSGILPLAGKRVALFGCTSYDWISGGSGFGGTSVGHYTVSLVEGMRSAGYEVYKPLIRTYTQHIAAEEKRLFPNGRPPFSLMPPARADEKQFTADELNAAIEGSDVAIISLGRKSGEAADRSEADFYLKEGEKQLIKAVSEAYHAKGKQVVVLLDICSPIDVASWQNQIDALVCTWQGGQESGFSLADVLSGKVNPSGKLPMTFQNKYGDAYADKNFPSNVDDKTLGAMFMWGYNKDQAPKERKPQANIDYTNYEEDIYVGYRYFDSFGKSVAYPFGFGLSYTTFGYDNLKVTEANGVFTVKVDVKNTGSKAGRNVVELFVAAPNSKKANKPEKELRNYAKTKLLQPGQTETITMQVKTEDLASFNEKASAWKTDAGVYTFMICSSANDVEAKATAKVKAWTKKVNNVMKPNVKLNLLKR